MARARETAIRAALGASLGQLALQYLAEGLIIALTGAAAGVLVSLVLVRLLLSVAIDSVPRADSIGVNWLALVFALAVAVVSSMLFSLTPLWQAARVRPQEALSEGIRSSAGAHSRRLSRGLVIAEIALAFTLLSVSTLLSSHLRRLLQTPAGFNADHLISFNLSYSDRDYQDLSKLTAYEKRLVAAIERIPGVTSAAISNQIPIEGCCYVTSLFPETGSSDPNDPHEVSIMITSPGYFRTMRIPVLKGRLPDEGHEKEGDTLAAVIDQAAASRYFPGRDPVGTFAEIGKGTGHRAHILAVVGSVRNRGLGKEPMPELFLPTAIGVINPLRFVVRSALPLSTLSEALRRAVQTVNPTEPVYGMRNHAGRFSGVAGAGAPAIFPHAVLCGSRTSDGGSGSLWRGVVCGTAENG